MIVPSLRSQVNNLTWTQRFTQRILIPHRFCVQFKINNPKYVSGSDRSQPVSGTGIFPILFHRKTRNLHANCRRLHKPSSANLRNLIKTPENAFFRWRRSSRKVFSDWREGGSRQRIPRVLHVTDWHLQ